MYSNSLKTYTYKLCKLQRGRLIQKVHRFQQKKSPEDISMIHSNILSLYKKYQNKSTTLTGFLTRQNPVGGISERNEHEKVES